MADTFNRMLKKKPDTFKAYARGAKGEALNASRALNCSRSAVWEQGDRIAKNARRQSDLEGLTGSLRFGDDGRRENFTLSVVEMTVNSDIVKVSLKKNHNLYNESINSRVFLKDRAMVGGQQVPIRAGQVRPPAGHSGIRAQPDLHRDYLHGTTINGLNVLLDYHETLCSFND